MLCDNAVTLDVKSIEKIISSDDLTRVCELNPVSRYLGSDTHYRQTRSGELYFFVMFASDIYTYTDQVYCNDDSFKGIIIPEWPTNTNV